MERPIERIKMLAQWLIEHGVVKNMLSFEKICSMSRCYVRNLMATGAGNPSIEVAANIYEVFPLVNLEWLVTGKGNMWGKRNEDDELVAEIQRRLPYRLHGGEIPLLFVCRKNGGLKPQMPINKGITRN